MKSLFACAYKHKCTRAHTHAHTYTQVGISHTKYKQVLDGTICSQRSELSARDMPRLLFCGDFCRRLTPAGPDLTHSPLLLQYLAFPKFWGILECFAGFCFYPNVAKLAPNWTSYLCMLHDAGRMEMVIVLLLKETERKHLYVHKIEP